MASPSHKKTANVCIGDTLLPVGQMHFTHEKGRQYSEFRYLESWVEDARGFSLSPTLRLGLAPFYASMGAGGDPRDSLPAVFQDATPDAWGRLLMERIHGAGLSEFDMLTLADDATRQGALRFTDGAGAVITGNHTPVPHLIQLDELRAMAARIEQRREMSNEDLRRLAGAGGSIGGARPKASVQDAEALWIAKFSSIGDQSPVERIEVATLHLARQCGLRTPDARLMLEATDHPVALIRRFDRRRSARIPYFSARTALGRSGAEQGSYTEIAEVIREISKTPREDLHELWARMLFTVLVTNTDDHLKNHGFLYAGDNLWRLSPLFDVNPQPERHRYLKTAIMEGEPFEASLDLALEAAEFFDLSREDAVTRASAMATTIAANWKSLMRQSGLSGAEIKTLEPAFDHEDADKARAGRAGLRRV
ncbi:type II toxin-antitoxin system HipA family toxin [Rhodovulum euryhalinum]|uniref:Serine/threonine-protein kinase HipA n=1 Tax=Rhodovulum euryhalinum TaxID=35805 RepID=A0A4R2KFG1_9RHOB|nr:type II toxin-antitoxin system HipA family toxin [Rhodovulum euryhalinum]TCO69089.1 serine/threonine-protein kinase HipA [Rhodovulum euryhalinum]